MKKILFFIPMLRVILITTTIGFTVIADAQQGVAINTDGTNADNSALLDIKSISKGILIPRLTAAQKTAISSPATGLLIYQTNASAGFYYYNGSAWTSLTSVAQGPLTGWATTGNTGTDSSINFIGTLDSKPLIGKVNGEQTFYFSSTNPATYIGYQAGKNNSGYYYQNTFIGYQAGYSNTTGNNNLFIGASAGLVNTTGINNLFVGNGAGYSNTTASENLFIGRGAGHFNTTGSHNTFIGGAAGGSNTTGNYNYFSGYNAGYNNETGSNNHFVGLYAGGLNTIGNDNYFSGTRAGFNNQAANFNHFVGNQAGYSNTGMSNFFEGFRAGYTNTTGTLNYFSGLQAGYFNTTASQNHFVGFQAGFNNTTGQNNHFTGFSAGTYNTTGSDNQFDGYTAGYSNTTGSHNYFSGSGAGYKNSVGKNNTYIGYQAGHEAVNAVSNVMIGHQAGYYETGSDKLYISNSFTTSPLIYGEFGNKMARVNGRLEINSTDLESLTIKRNGPMSIDFVNPAYAGDGVSITGMYDDTFAGTKLVFHGANTNILTLIGTGNAVLAGTLTQNSDKRLKKNIIPLKNPLQKIMNVSGYTYNWIDAGRDNSEQIGFIAQDLEKEFPQLVKTDDKGMKSVAYANMVPILVEAIKEQQKQIDELKKMIELLSKK